MYSKLFASMFDGTLATQGPWQAIVTFQQMVILCDPTGIIDMTAEALSRRTTVPIEIIRAGIAALEAPDPNSRIPDEGGRRIKLLDPEHRDWGWQIVNFVHYRNLRNNTDRREYQKELMRKRRAAAKATMPVSDVSDVSNISDVSPRSKQEAGSSNHSIPLSRDDARRVIDYLNDKTGHAYQHVPANLKLVLARFNDGATVEDCQKVIDAKTREWKGNPDMAKFLAPDTLFNATKFAKYQGQLGATQQQREVID
jgi:uncharacterized phage protein (TIGR02220 family)